MGTFEWTRRDFLKATGASMGAGILQPVISLLDKGKSISEAYPAEMLSIEQYTKGKVKPGMIISKDNADLVRDLCPEGLYVELTRGREIQIGETTLNLEAFVPQSWIEATLKNKGQAVLDKNGQLWTKDGQPWIGGDPFPEAKTGLEAMWNHTFNVYRLDDYMTAATELDIDRDGRLVRRTTSMFVIVATVGRVAVSPKPFLPKYKGELFRNVLYFSEPFDVFGLSIANIVPYDASALPDTMGYIPTLRRVRRLTSTQRFEPPRPYATYFLSDFNVHSDPILTWSWKLVGRKPMLYPAPVNVGLYGAATTKQGFSFPFGEEKFPRSTWELRPEVLVVEGIPQLAGAAYSKKLVYVDAVIGRAACGDMYDKAGKIWKWTAFFISRFKRPDGYEFTGASSLFFADVQKDYRTNIWNLPELGGIKTIVNSGLNIDDWITPQALLQRAKR